jgi:amino acid adenylation domain-containing protein
MKPSAIKHPVVLPPQPQREVGTASVQEPLSARLDERTFPLSPMQEGLLFNSLYATDSGVDISQIICDWEESVDAAWFGRAWQHVAERHSILRTSFRWEGLASPRQQVNERVRIPVRLLDWSGLSAKLQGERLEALLQADKQTRFDFSVAPLMRVALIRLDGTRCQFVWSIHHLLSDSQTVVLMLNDLFASYQALQAGQEPSLPPAPEYRAYVAWLQGQDQSEAESFWRGRLAGFTTPTPLPACAKESHSTVASGEWAEEETTVSEETIRALRAGGKAHGLTLNTFLQGAWALVLSRYSGEDDVVFGAVKSCRNVPVPGAGDIAGPFINTLPVRVRCEADQPLLEWLRAIRQQWVELRQFEHSPLARVQSWSETPPGQPLFPTMMSVLDPPWDAVLRQTWRDRRFRIHNQPNYPLTLDVYVAGSARLTLVYDAKLYEQPAIKRLLGHLRTVLEAMANAPEQRISELPMLSKGELELLAGWNETTREFPRETSVGELFERVAANAPDSVAVVDGEEKCTYGQLNGRANRLAHHLRSLGVKTGTPVAVHLERGLPMIVAFLAVLKAGGAYVPLDRSYPKDRIAFMIEDTEAPVLITITALKDALPDTSAEEICLEVVEAQLTNLPEENLPPAANGGSLACVIYTSGSMGTPKGVCVPHRGIARTAINVDYAPLTPQDVVPQISNCSFDAATWEIWGALLNGARLVIFPSRVVLNVRALVEAIRRHEITSLFITTALFNQVAAEVPAAFRKVRQVLFGGEAADPKWPAAILRSGPPERLLNVYGPTETTTYATWHLIKEVPVDAHSIPICRPIANTTACVLDKRLNPVPIGAVGELFIGGDGVALGYLKRPELTAEKFITHPRWGRLYRTGDLVRRLDAGELDFLGRADHQVKIRGFRVEPGEIENCLNSHPDVSQSIVIVRKDAAGTNQLVGYFTPRKTPGPGSDDLHAYLRAKLPDYMVPPFLIGLPQLPVNPNGKIDRQALPAPDVQSSGTDFVAPRNADEEVLAGIWGELLGLQRVGVRDNYFQLGGHSLLVTQLISRIRTAFGMELPLHAVFEHPTIEQLAVLLNEGQGDSREAFLPAIARRSDKAADQDTELSFAQERMWFLEELEPGLAVNNVPIGIVLEGDLNLGALEQSLNTLVARHASLRTSFCSAQGRPTAQANPAVKLELPLVALDHLSDRERAAEVERVMAGEAGQPFDLGQGLLLRTRLLRLDRRKHLLMLTTHHIVSDGWTMGVLYRELRELYEAFVRDGNAALPALPLEFADYARWQREWLQGEVLEEQLGYWKRQLQGPLPVLDLPADHPRPAQQSYRGAVKCFTLPDALSEALRSLCRREDVTLFMLLLGAFQTLLHRYSGQTDIVTGTTVAGRTRAELEGLAGLFLNTLALRTDLSGEPTFRELLQRVRKIALEAYTYQHVPFEKVVEAVDVERDLSRSPVFQAMFILQKAPLPSARAGDLEWSSVSVHNGASKFDLTLSMEEDGEQLNGYVEYNCALFEADTVARLLGHFQTLLEGVVENPDAKLGALPMLTAAEQKQLLEDWNPARTSYPGSACVHTLIEEQVARTPDAIAAAFENQQLTYRQMNERADALAGHLLSLGVGPDVRVGLCLNRSLDMLVALLGVLKTGAAYVPVDPLHPKERLEFMLEDSRASVLLTQQPVRDHCKFEIPDLKVLCLDALVDGTRSIAPDGSRTRTRTKDDDDRGPRSTHHASTPHSAFRTPQSSSPAYVIYTSGSTGKPKGVVIPHRAVVNFLTSMAREPGLTADDVLIAVTTLSFDIAVLELLLPLTVGARVVIADHDETLDGHALRALLERHRATVVQATPVTWRLLLDAGWSIKPRSTDSLVRESGTAAGQHADMAARAPASPPFKALVGGEALPEELAAQLIARGVELWNMYGPTETTVWSTCARIRDTSKGITIGKPIANTVIRILDPWKNLCPAGVPGELCIGGDGVALGYWGRPDLTADRFIPDPYRPGAVLYRTGDLARWRNDGALEHLGRLDFQVKLRGFRIELGEIEAVIAQHPAVRETAVIAREDTAGDKRLVAYVVAGNGPPDLMEQLRARLRAALPEYMVPLHFVLLDALPRTHNGKIDRKALPAPNVANASNCAPAVAPRTPAEEMVLGIFRSLLDREDFGVLDNFFDLGGHSLMAARLMAQLRTESGVDLPLRDLFTRPTVAGLAEAIDAHQWVQASASPTERADVREEIAI